MAGGQHRLPTPCHPHTTSMPPALATPHATHSGHPPCHPLCPPTLAIPMPPALATPMHPLCPP
eukprot:351999-Chlamydomonas_euryale.AAC.2